MKLWKKPVVITAASAVVVSSILMTNTSFAAAATKKLTAVYSNIVIKYNGNQVRTDSSTEPFMVDGTTFVPVRLIGEATGNKITWNQTTKTIDIASSTSATDQTTINNLTKSLAEAKLEISDNELEIKKLEANLAAALEDSSTDIDDLESDIQDDYEDYEDTEAAITVSGDEDDVKVAFKVDPDGWSDLTSSEQASYLQDIVDDILDAYEDADITGTIKSNDDSSTLATFGINSRDDVELEEVAADLDDLEEQLNDDYGDYEDLDLEVILTGDEDDITIKVNVIEDNWSNLSSSDQNDLQDSLVSDVEDEFPDADISGYIYNEDGNTRLDTF